VPTFRTARSQIKLHQGDCLEFLPRLPEASVDVVVTSPPYNIGIRYGAYDDTELSRKEYLDWLAGWALQVRRVLKPDGSLFLNLGSKPTDPWVPFEVITRLKEILALQNVIHWIKSIAIEKDFVGEGAGLAEDLTVGHYKPINSNRFLNDCHEYVFHLTHRGDVSLDRLAVGVPYQDKSNLRRWTAAASDRHCRGNTWFIPYRTIQSRRSDRPHPASFPVELARKCILLHGARPGLKVMDPFLGIGHSALAAIQTGSDFLGCELDPEYFEVAFRAVQEAVPPPRTEAAAPREAQAAQMELF
jgi:site-specific DNA-methyltransferase (adenine-specific)